MNNKIQDINSIDIKLAIEDALCNTEKAIFNINSNSYVTMSIGIKPFKTIDTDKNNIYVKEIRMNLYSLDIIWNDERITTLIN